jgi:hypothetical protein
MLNVNVPTNTPFETAAIYQALPEGFGDFTAVAKVSLMGRALNYFNFGMMLMEGTTNTSDLACIALSYRNTTGPTMIWTGNLTDYLAGSGTTYPVLIGSQTHTDVYLRIRRSGTTLFREYSIGGVGFSTATVAAEPFVPVNIGLWWGNDNTGQTYDVYFDFFRYKASNDSGPIGSW